MLKIFLLEVGWEVVDTFHNPVSKKISEKIAIMLVKTSVPFKKRVLITDLFLTRSLAHPQLHVIF